MIEARYIIRRVVVALILAVIFALVRKAQSSDYLMVAKYFGTYSYPNAHYITVVNPSASAVTVRNNGPTQGHTGFGANGGFFYASVRTLTGANVTIPAGGSIDCQIYIEVGSSGGYVNNTTDIVITPNLELAITNHNTGAAFINKFTLNKSYDLRYRDLAKSMTPTGDNIGTVYLSNPPPSGKVTIVADALAAGSQETRSYSIGDPGEFVPVLLVNGSNVVLQTSTPENYSGDVRVYQQGIVIGMAPIVKDQFGNFDVTVQATGAEVVARITVTHTPEVTGTGRLLIQGMAAQAMTFTGTPTVFDYADPFNYPDGAWIRVERETPAQEGEDGPSWQVVGSSILTKDVLGGWNIVIQATGSGSPESAGGSNDAVFHLDALVYDGGSKVVQLKINGQTYEATPSGMIGDPSSGRRIRYTVVISNADGELHGKDFSWQVTGIHEGKAVRDYPVAVGTTPSWSGAMQDGDPPTPINGYEVSSSATVGVPQGAIDPTVDDPPPNPYDPSAPIDPESPDAAQQEAKKDNYESTRAAVSDAMKDENPFPESSASMDLGSADDYVQTVADIGQKAVDAYQELKGELAAPLVSQEAIGTSSTYTFSLPVLGSYTYNAATLGSWPGWLRTMLLGLLGFCAALVAGRIMMQAFR